MRHFVIGALGSVFLAAMTLPAVHAQSGPIKSVDAFYTANMQKPVWRDDARYDALITAIEGLHAHGLTPEDYSLSKLKTARADRQGREKLATQSWMLAASHMVHGKLSPMSYEPNWTLKKRDIDPASALGAALASGDIAGSFDRLAPQSPVYAAMRKELAALRALDGGDQVKVAAGPALKSGMSGTRVDAVQLRLIQLGLLSPDYKSGLYDAQTIASVTDFQNINELDADGIAGAATIGALNRDNSERRAALRVNMERARWMPDDLGIRHVRVNIAEFKVTAWQDGKIEQTHLGIVGKPYRATPVFSDEFEYIVFNPWWEVPHKLARLDKLPVFKRDPGAVKRLGFQVLDGSGKVVDPNTIDWTSISADRFPYRLRQGPGEQNALGQVKMIFPNQHAVYLHDTPTRGLFASRQRAFSSGCIRVQEPISLSKWLLAENPIWTGEKIDAALASGKETRAELTVRVPVHIQYNTVVSDGAGALRYLDDIYGRDGKVLAGLGAEKAG
ncbi:L,D-transpeptidase family protein [Robiginitomaculum antarcticum]|uniref:L,D-transpeptidase family protein n=1 Tax=Robiginitomaculum antarcticum TaxID=437507 RepID=UPI0003706E96|nr:L,D-transpeptidase family protein [Robiginitomaculum antarcticum]